MPRFFFDIHDGTNIRDDEGIECADEVAARIEAARAAGELLRDQSVDIWNGSPWRIEVRDEAGRIVAALTISGSQLACS